MLDGADKGLLEWARIVKGGLQRQRTPLEGLWRDIRDNFEPALGHALDDSRDLDDSAAKRGDAKIINSKSRDVVSRLSSGLQSGITNQARQWFRLVDKGAAGDKENSSRERRAIDAATELLQSTIAGSNIYTALISIYMRLGQFGTACALLVPDEFATVRLDVVDEGAYWLAQDRRGRVCTMLRRCEWTRLQVVEEFGEDAVPANILREVRDGNGHTFVRVWHLVTPTQEVPRKHRDEFAGHAFASLYWVEGDGQTQPIAKRGFDYNPIIAPRWEVPTGSVYGIGLGQKALPDAKELQALELAKMRIVAQEADPPMAAPEKMRGVRLSMNPGAVNYFSEGAGGQSAGHIPIQPIDTRPKRLDFVEAAINTQEQRLGRLFYEDLFAMLLQIQMGAGKRQMTATEVSELASEKIALLGPILTRLNHDLLHPLVGGVYAICVADAKGRLDSIMGAEMMGATPDAERVIADAERFRALAEVDELDLDVEYTSTLHIQQLSNARTLGVVHLMEYVGMFSNYDAAAIDNIDIDKAVRLGAKSYMEHGIVRDEKDVATIRKGRAAQQEQQMQLAQAKGNADVQKQQADIVKTIAESQAAAGGDAFAQGGIA